MQSLAIKSPKTSHSLKVKFLNLTFFIFIFELKAHSSKIIFLKFVEANFILYDFE